MECPELEISDVELESRMEGRKIGAQVNFTCPRGFDLKGLNQIVCQKNGNHSALKMRKEFNFLRNFFSKWHFIS